VSAGDVDAMWHGCGEAATMSMAAVLARAKERVRRARVAVVRLTVKEWGPGEAQNIEATGGRGVSVCLPTP
jgi:hypothetical protein